MAAEDPADASRFSLSRRQLLLGGAAAGLGAAAGIGVGDIVQGRAGSGVSQMIPGRPTPTAATGALESGVGLVGARTVDFHGLHQAGVAVVPQAHSVFLAWDLRPEIDRDGLVRMMGILTDDARRLTQGTAALADSEPEMAGLPARMTVTFGFGAELVRRGAGESAVPSWLGPLPAFGIDRLDEAWCGGDLLVEVAADDPTTVAHGVRMMAKDLRSFAVQRWRQDGFRQAAGARPEGASMRNLFGQVDGTVNLVPGTADFDSLAYAAEGWLAGGSSFVLRRIRMDLDKWDKLDRSGREQSVGRTLSNGAPLTGSAEQDEPDFTATTAVGFPVIPEFSHMRRARSEDRSQRILRRGYNYEQLTDGAVESGLLFGSYQADVTAQFVPLQRRLDELDLLNEWTTPVGSAVFAIPPGCGDDGFVGETLLG